MEGKGGVLNDQDWKDYRIETLNKRRKETLGKILFSKRQHPSQVEQEISANYLVPEASKDIQMDSFEQEKEELNH